MFIDYKVYINSSEWIEKRNTHIQKDPVCRACGSDKQITLHHITYKNLGNEKKGDLMTLCWSCHEELHNGFNSDNKKKNLSGYSKWFRRTKRVEIGTNKMCIKYKRTKRKKNGTDDLIRK